MNTPLAIKRIGETGDNLVQLYQAAYPKQFESYEKSPVVRAMNISGKKPTQWDYLQLGKQLEAVQYMFKLGRMMRNGLEGMGEATTNLTATGPYPNIALDAVQVFLGASPLSLMVSTQAINQIQGMVYYKNLIAQQTRGNVTAGQSILTPLGLPQAFPQGYAADFQLTTWINDATNAQSFTGGSILPSGQALTTPIDPQRITINITTQVTISSVTHAMNFAGMVCDATGNFSQNQLVGTTMVGVYGNVNATTGGATCYFSQAPTGGSGVPTVATAKFYVLNAAASDIPQINPQYVTKSVMARFFGLKTTVDIQEAFQMQTMFNIDMQAAMATDLANGINMELCNEVITMLYQNVPSGSNVVWPLRQPQLGVSDSDHLKSFESAFRQAESNLLVTAGRGSCTLIIAGLNMATVMSTLDDFVQTFNTPANFGPHLFGSWKGIPVVRAPYASIFDANTLVGLYKGDDPFEAPVVYTPFMPFWMSAVLPIGPNLMQSGQACAVWAGIDPLLTNFLFSMTVDLTGYNFGSQLGNTALPLQIYNSGNPLP